PPRALGADVSTSAGPPPTRIFRSIPSWKNPIQAPSGDQNGNQASSVRSSGFASNESSERRKRRDASAFDSRAPKTTRLPSGEIAGGAGESDSSAAPTVEKAAPSGGGSESRSEAGGAARDLQYAAPRRPSAAARTATEPQATRSRPFRRVATVTGIPACEPP